MMFGWFDRICSPVIVNLANIIAALAEVKLVLFLNLHEGHFGCVYSLTQSPCQTSAEVAMLPIRSGQIMASSHDLTPKYS